VAALPMFGADPSQSARRIFDMQLNAVEGELMAIVETMPASKFGFAPSKGHLLTREHSGCRPGTLHSVSMKVATALLAEPMLPHADQEGPRDLTSKEDVVQYLKDAFAHAHRAIGTLTSENLLEPIRDPYVQKLRTTRLDAATIFLSHTWDHYGQMVEYLRMNNLVPPGHQ
jgi:hypothetical protein